MKLPGANALLSSLLLLALACKAPPMPPQVQRNVALLQQPDEGPRRQALQALTEMGPSAASAIPAVARLAEEASGALRGEAIVALVTLDPHGQRAVSPIVKALQAPDAELKELASIGLGLLGSAGAQGYRQVSALTEDPNPDVRAAALYAVAKIKPNEVNVRRLYGALGSAEPRVRFMALRAMRELGSSAVRELPPIIAAIHDDNVGVATQAMRVLAQLGQAARVASAELSQMVDKPGLTEPAVSALLSIDPEGATVAPLLCSCVERCSSVEARGRAVEGLGSLPKQANGTTQALLTGLKDADPRVALSALHAIDKLRPAYTELRRELLAAMQAQDSALAWKATEIAGEYGAEAIGELVTLQDGSKRNRLQAAYGLGRLPPTPQTRQALEHASTDGDSDVREQVALALRVAH